MKTITIEMPEKSGVNEFEAKMILAGELYEREKVTLGEAAQIAGISKCAFIETIGGFGFSIFGNDEAAILADVRNA